MIVLGSEVAALKIEWSLFAVALVHVASDDWRRFEPPEDKAEIQMNQLPWDRPVSP